MPDPIDLERKPDENVVALAERMLEDAKSGKLQGIVIAGVTNYGHVIHSFAGEIRLFSMIGAIESAKLELFLQQGDVVRALVREMTDN